MSGRALNAALGAALLAVWGLTWATRRDRALRSRSFMPEMARSLTHEAQGAGALWPEGVPPEPPEGRVARGHPPLPYGPGPADAERAGRELKNPYAAGPRLEAHRSRGAGVFASFCLPCHGPTGRGDGPVLKAGVPAPPSLLGDSARRMPDGRLFHVVTYGQKTMPAHAAQVSREDRWKAVLHVRDLQRAADAGAAAAKAAAKAPAAGTPPASKGGR